jgi:hypothetical protein
MVMAALSAQVLGHVVGYVPQVGQVGSDIRRRAPHVVQVTITRTLPGPVA